MDISRSSPFFEDVYYVRSEKLGSLGGDRLMMGRGRAAGNETGEGV